MICPNCGSIQSNDASSCTICGYEFYVSKIGPKLPESYDKKQFSLAKLYYQQNNIEQFQQVINQNEFEQLESKDKEELSELIATHAESILATENWINAEPFLIKSLRLNPKKKERVNLLLNGLYFKRGKQIYETNNLKEALASLLQAKNYGNLEADNLIEEIRFQLAKKHIKNGKLKAALFEIKECLRINPSNNEYIEIKTDLEKKIKEKRKATIKKAMPFAIATMIILLAFLAHKKFIIGQVSFQISTEDYIIKSALPQLSEMQLSIDGKERKNWGNFQSFNISAKNHIVEIEHEKYEKFIDTIKVKAGRLNQFNFTLKPKYSNVLIKSNPEKAKAYISDNFIGETPITLKLPLGDHQLILMKSSYQEKRQTITIKDTVINEFNIALGKMVEFDLVSDGSYEDVTWKIEPNKLFSYQGEPLLPDIAKLVFALESRDAEGVPVSKQEFIDMLSRPEAQIVYRDEIIKYATPTSLAIQKKEHEDYTKIFMSENYQRAGLEFLRSQRAYLERAEREYNVLQQDIVSVLIWESGLGKYTGNYQVFNVFLGQILFLNTAQKSAVRKLIADGKPNPLEDAARAQKERTRLEKRKTSAVGNLAALLRVCKKTGLDPLEMKGSLGGAIGSVQFMPANLKYAVDGDADGKVNLSQWPDAIMSVGNYLKTLGKYEATDAGRNRALLRYNPSKEYAAGVMLLADTIWQRHLNGE